MRKIFAGSIIAGFLVLGVSTSASADDGNIYFYNGSYSGPTVMHRSLAGVLTALRGNTPRHDTMAGGSPTNPLNELFNNFR